MSAPLQEDQIIRSCISTYMPIEQLATVLKCPIEAVKPKIENYAFEMYQRAVPLPTLYEHFRYYLTRFEIDQFVIKRRQSKQKKQPQQPPRQQQQKPRINDSQFTVLWAFKEFMKSRVDFDVNMHNLFDEFVKTYPDAPSK